MKKVCMIGSGYVGLVTGTCFAELGHRVICLDNNRAKIDTLKAGKVPIYEPGLGALIKKNVRAGRLSFTTDMATAVRASEIIFITVNTPPLPKGEADLSYVEACTREVIKHADRYKLLVEKSTVPVQTGDRIQKTLSMMGRSGAFIEVASNPEFLREGSAIQDFLKPDRIVVGVGSKRAEKIFRDLYRKIKAPLIVTNIESAELIKHASNSFLALKISYANCLAQICERVGADVKEVTEGMGMDRRIGRSFLNAGIGYGGSCFPKDIAAFIKIAEKNGFDFELLKATEKINQHQRTIIVKKLEEALWTLKDKTIAVWGLSFKPNTDDLRDAPSATIIQELIKAGANVRAYDPVAMKKMEPEFPSVQFCAGALEAAKNADALLVVTEWEEFKRVNLKKLKASMNAPIVVDGRNVFEPSAMAKLGFHYSCIGRGLRPELIPTAKVKSTASV